MCFACNFSQLRERLSHLAGSGHPLVVTSAVGSGGIAGPIRVQGVYLTIDPRGHRLRSLFEVLECLNEPQEFFEFDAIAHYRPIPLPIDPNVCAELVSCSS